MKPMTLQTISQYIEAQVDERHATVIVSGAAVDSRLVELGDLFFALPGSQVDGHEYLEKAAQKGALAAVVSSEYIGSDYGLALISCKDVLKALQSLARRLLAESSLRIVAVTGSVGKTTTKDMICRLLSHKFRVSVSPGNSNSQIGLPLSIINHTDLEGDILILEMGMTHSGNISQLVEIAPPEVAVITTVALVHACNFSSLADIARAKGEIFSHPHTKMAIYHHESDIDGILTTSFQLPKHSFSVENRQADFCLKEMSDHHTVKDPEGDSLKLGHLAIPGKHNIQNFLAAVAVARYFGMNQDEIAIAQKEIKLPERRLQQVEKFGAIFINDSYNASEISVKAALNSLPNPKPSCKRIMVLGEMAELGKFSEDCHRAVGEAALKTVDMVFCFGDGTLPVSECWKRAGKPVFWGKERMEIVARLREYLNPGDVVLLKGSRSKGVWNVLDELEIVT